MSSAPPPPQRGEVYWLDFAPATGHEMTGMHPCVIVQNDVGNHYSALTIVVAVTSNLRVASLPIGVLLKAGEGGPHARQCRALRPCLRCRQEPREPEDGAIDRDPYGAN